MMKKKAVTLFTAAALLITMSSPVLAESEVANSVYGVPCAEGASLGDKGCLPLDVEEGTEQTKTIVDVIASGIMTTDEQANFRPNDDVRAGEAVTVLLRVLGMPPEDAKGDVSESAIKTGSELGLVQENINIDQPMSRLEFVIVLAKALNIEPARDPLPFRDTDNLPLEVRQILAGLYKAGLIQGTSDVTFEPDRVLTRYELAILVERVLKNFK